MPDGSVKPKILVVDDEEYLCELLKEELLSTKMFEVDIANDGAQAINKIQNGLYDLVLLDIKMPRISGIEVLKFIKEFSPDTEVIMITAHGDIKLAVETIKLGAFDFITKPNNSDSIKVSGIAAQFIATNGLSRLGLFLWIRRAMTSFPVPLSP